MDEIELNVKGIRSLKLQVYFCESYLNMGQKNKWKKPAGSQYVTTCIIRRNGLILGTGVSVCHPDDTTSADIGRREAFKRAARLAGWHIIRALTPKEQNEIDTHTAMWKHLFSAWRKALREQAEAEKA